MFLMFLLLACSPTPTLPSEPPLEGSLDEWIQQEGYASVVRLEDVEVEVTGPASLTQLDVLGRAVPFASSTFFGVIRNDGNETLCDIQTETTLFDADDAVVNGPSGYLLSGTVLSLDGQNQPHCLRPGESGRFNGFDLRDVDTVPSRMTVGVVAEVADDAVTPAPNLTWNVTTVDPVNRSAWVDVTNTGDAPVEDVLLWSYALAADTTMTDSSHERELLPRIEPGETVTITLGSLAIPPGGDVIVYLDW